MDKFIKKECVPYDLSNDDIKRIFGNEPIILYKELYNMNQERLLRKFKKTKRSKVEYLILLIEISSPTYGHWVVLLNHGNNNMEYFDSYGSPPDHYFETGKYYYKNMKPILLDLLSGYTVTYNNIRLQEAGKDINTCGRWVTSRIKLRDFSLKEYQNLFKNKKYTFNRDELICAMTLLTGAF